MDHGSLGEDAVSRPGPHLLLDPLLDQSSHPQDYPRYQHQHQHQQYLDDHFDHFEHPGTPDQLDPLDPRPTQVIVPINPYAAANLHAFSANARATENTPDDPVDPADFYRNYRSLQTGNASSSVKDPMASALPASTRQPPSLRSNGNGTTPKHPPITSHRSALRPGHRSSSNPVDNRSGNSGTAVGRPSLAAGTGHNTDGGVPPSVKDLKKKFDQSSQPSSPARKAGSRTLPRTSTSLRDATSESVSRRGLGVGSGGASYGAPRTTATRNTGHEAGKGSGTRGAQRSKFATGDQASTSSESFASRISRPRTATSANEQASKSVTQPTSRAVAEPPNSLSSPPRQNGLLFGEILPEQSDSATPGFGIQRARPRRTSESSIQNPARSQIHPLVDPDAEPPSPTDWYRAAESGAQQKPDHHASRVPKSHSRAHSDLAGSKLALIRPDFGAARRDAGSPISPTSPASASSRLPRLAKRVNDTPSHGSPVSSRSSSPSAFKYSSASGRTSRQHVSSASRARTPTSTSTTQIKTPTHIPSTARKAPPSNISTHTNSRLNAYVSVPAPKLSPSLRTSRTRQSVATATTTASRMRVNERGASPLRHSLRPPTKPDESTPRRRKVSVGAIDFAQRRETIKLAYSKSIRDNQAREARKAAAEKRKKELVAVARAKTEAEAATAAAVANATAAAAVVAAQHPRKASGSSRPSETTTEEEKPRIEEPRVPTTELLPIQLAIEEPHGPLESLKLEIPDSFPNLGSPPLSHDEIPLSAVSATSAVTEFDIEEQTEPPRQEVAAVVGDATGVISLVQAPTEPEAPVEQQFPEQQFFEEQFPEQQFLEEQFHEQPSAPALHRRASYQSPFDEEGEEDDSISIKISLDTSIPEPHPHPQPSPQLTPTRADFESEHIIIPPPAEEDEYVPRPYTYSSDNYATTVTILGPENDFRPFHQDLSCTTILATDLPQADELPVISAPETVASEAPQPDEVHFEKPQAGIENQDRIEDFYVGPRLRDNIAALRDSTFTPSDLDTPLDGHPSEAEYQNALNTSHSLTVPALLAPGNRLSQHSAWTDFSFGSEDLDPDRPHSASHSNEPDTQDDGRIRIIPSTGDLSTCASSLGEFTQSPDASPLDSSGTPSPPMRPEAPTLQQHLPELETVESFTAPGDSESGTIAAQPERNSPDPPSSERGYERTSTLYLAESRPESYAYSQDDRDDFAESASPPDSASQHRLDSLEPSQVSLSETLYEKQIPLTEEEQVQQKRLRQRQLVIRELIDTEDAFIRDMTVVEEIYKGTAEACPNLDNKTIKLVFRNSDEIIAFHAALLVEFKEGASTVYTPKGRRSPLLAPDAKDSDSATLNSIHSSNKPDRDDEKDRLSSLGPVFSKNIDQLKAVHEVYLRSSDHSSKRLVQIQEDKTVMLWLNECNEVAKELTTAWNLDSLLIKPMQRITKYPDIITHLLKYTPEDHPDREALVSAKATVIEAIDEINKTKKNFELVGQIVSNRKRKESDVRAGLARAFGKRVDKLQVSGVKTAEDDEYQKLQQQFGDDYLRLQVVLRDVEYYTRNVADYVHEFLQYLSSIELVMRLQPSRDYAHLESKWVQFNVSMRDMEKIALEKHLADVRKHVIEPFEQVIRCYGNPSLAMKKRAKRRLDYEKYVQLKANGKKVDKQLAELVEQYEALNDTLKKELPKLSAMTAKIGNICLGKFISIQATWFSIWKEKVKAPLQDAAHVPELSEIVSTFQREFGLQEERAMALGIVNPTLKSRVSQSTTDDASSILSKTRSRPSDIMSPRGRGLSINSDYIPSLPTPDFAKRHSGQFSLSPASSALPSPANYYRDYYSGINSHGRGSSGSPITPADPHYSNSSTTINGSARSTTASFPPMRPSTGRSFDSTSLPRQSSDSTVALSVHTNPRRDSNSTFNSSYIGGGPGPSPNPGPSSSDQPRRLSGLFHSALPLPDGPDERSQRSSRASSRDRGGVSGGYKVLWLAASLFEFNIETTKHEAGYPYLTYQAGEIFDVIAEKGELWLAKNQDDPRDVVGWIWSKHFAKLADS